MIENPVSIHHKIVYEDSDMSLEDLNELDFSLFKDKFVKVVVKNRSNPYLFDLLVERISDSGAADLKTVEDTLSFETGGADDIGTESKNTREILHDYVDSMETKVSKEKIKIELDTLYTEALNIT